MDSEPSPSRRLADPTALRVAAYIVIVVAGSWWMLDQLEAVLRPLMLAVFLAYVVMPYYGRLRAWVSAPTAIAVLGGVTIGCLLIVALIVYAGLEGLQSEERSLKARAGEMVHAGADWLHRYVPGALGEPVDGQTPGELAADRLTEAGVKAANIAALSLLEAATAGLYLLFLLTEAARFPDRVRAAYPPERAEQILQICGRINASVMGYIKGKAVSSLVLAVPVGVILAVCGVKFALLWAVLTFAGNFIPYVGSWVAYTLPVLFGFLQLDLDWRPVTAAAGLLVCHGLSSFVVEPMILGKAVGLSPLVILAALALWGLLWGLPGLFLAVPLTVALVLVLENIDATRPVARLLTG